MARRQFALLMAMILAVGPFAVNAYLPGMPSMASHLNVGTESIATTVSLYIFGMALGQILGGPLADRFEKRTIIVVGLSLYAACSIVITCSDNFHILQLSRVFQAIGGGFATVCIAPLVREREKGNNAAKLFGLIGLIMVMAPAIAPSIGAFILLFGQWQNIFYFTSFYAALVALLVALFLPVSSKKHTKSSTPAYKRYLTVVQNKVAMCYLLVQACSYSVMMVFVTNASFIYQDVFGLDAQMFALAFAVNTLGNIVVNRSNSKLLRTTPAYKLLKLAILLQAVFVCVLPLFIFLKVPVYIFVIGVIGAIGMLGAIMPNANALYMSQFTDDTGAASALLGAGQYLTGALMGGLTSLFYNGSLWPIVVVMLTLVVISNSALPRNIYKPKPGDKEISEK
ncbi:multidrug effflux MFS transporter [Vibrio sp. HN007]|uniref:multidrug effflux MFS transporter n=1 Tax=Vibrio iocasae TaxID=3098914 RepID=UPI0035D465B9